MAKSVAGQKKPSFILAERVLFNIYGICTVTLSLCLEKIMNFDLLHDSHSNLV